MTDFDVVKLGTSKLDPKSRLPQLQATAEVTEEGDAENFGELATYGVPCVTWLPAAANEEGHCEALVARDVAGVDAAVIGARDERLKMSGELSPGDVCVHPMDPSFESRLLLKNKVAGLLASTRSAFVIDDTTGTATLSIGGAVLQIGQDGIKLLDASGNGITVINGVVSVKAPAVFLGAGTAMCPMSCHPVVTPSPSSVPTTCVLVPDPTAPV